MLTFSTFRLFKKTAVTVYNTVNQIWLILGTAISNNTQHNRKLNRCCQVKALTDGSIEGITQAPVLIPDFTLYFFRGNKAFAFAFQVNTGAFAKAKDMRIFFNIINADAITKLVKINVITHRQRFDKCQPS